MRLFKKGRKICTNKIVLNSLCVCEVGYSWNPTYEILKRNGDCFEVFVSYFRHDPPDNEHCIYTVGTYGGRELGLYWSRFKALKETLKILKRPGIHCLKDGDVVSVMELNPESGGRFGRISQSWEFHVMTNESENE